MCKPGWYWVSKGGVWRCAYWDGEDWAFGESLYDDAAWDKIGPRIPTPDEPWQCVPVAPTREMLEVTGDKSADAYAGMLGAWTLMLAAAPRP